MLDISQRSAFRPRTGYLFLSVMLGHLILVSAQVQSKSGVPVLEAVTFGVFSRVQHAVATVMGGARGAWTNYADLRGVRTENEALRQKLADLEVRLQGQRALAASAARLQELMDLRSSTSLPTIAAEVIGGNPNPGMLTITIDRGSADGVLADMAVIAPTGIVGRIIAPVASRAARVQLIIDRAAALGALTERARAGGMIVGTDDDPPLRMELVSNLSDVQAGDLVVASGVEGIYPKGFAIGTVESSDRGPGLHRLISVRPAVDFSSIEEVLVVLVPARGATPDDPGGAPSGGGK
jgi:rod shape-determining protein MreC